MTLRWLGQELLEVGLVLRQQRPDLQLPREPVDPDAAHAHRSGHVQPAEREPPVVVQVGRLYFLNEDAVAWLSRRAPWHVESIRGREVVKVYRLLPPESPFPNEVEHAAQN